MATQSNPETFSIGNSDKFAQLCNALNSLTNGCGSTDGLTALADALVPTKNERETQTQKNRIKKRSKRSVKLRQRSRKPRLPEVRLTAASTFPTKITPGILPSVYMPNSSGHHMTDSILAQARQSDMLEVEETVDDGSALTLFEDGYNQFSSMPRQRQLSRKKRGRDNIDDGGAIRNTKKRLTHAKSANIRSANQKHMEQLNYLNGIVEREARALYGTLHGVNGSRETLATDDDSVMSLQIQRNRAARSRWKLPSLDKTMSNQAWPNEIASILEFADESGNSRQSTLLLHDAPHEDASRLADQQRLAQQGNLTMIAAAAMGPSQSVQLTKHVHNLEISPKRIRKRGLLNPLHDLSHATPPLGASFLESVSQHRDKSGILTTITNSSSGHPYLQEKEFSPGSSVRLITGGNIDNVTENGFAKEGILESMLLATSAAAQATMIDGDVTNEYEDGKDSVVQTIEREPATVLDSNMTIVEGSLLDGSVFYTQRELEKKLWQRRRANFLPEQSMTRAKVAYATQSLDAAASADNHSKDNCEEEDLKDVNGVMNVLHKDGTLLGGLERSKIDRPASSSTAQRYIIEDSCQSHLEKANQEEGDRQHLNSLKLGEQRVKDIRNASSLGALIKDEIQTIYGELPLTFLFERQLSGLFALRFRRVMQHMLTRWMHGYYIEALARWHAFLEADFSVRQTNAAILVQKTRRGYLARRRVRKIREEHEVQREQKRFDAMMMQRKRWLSATDIEKVWRGHLDRTGDLLKEARHRMRCIVLVQGRWRIKKSRFLALVLGARHKLRNISAIKIQRIALGYAGRKRAKLRRKVVCMEERERLLGDREYVITHGFRRHGAAVLLQRWIRHMQGGWMNPHFRGHDLMLRPQRLWRGWRVRSGERLKELRLAAWMQAMCTNMRFESEPAALKIQIWWRGRTARRLMQAMRQAVREHTEALRHKKELAFQSKVVAAPGILGKVGVKVDVQKMRRRSHSLRRAFSMKMRGKEKHAALHLQMWWRSQFARLEVRRRKKLEKMVQQKKNNAAAIVIQRTVARGCAGRRQFYQARLLRSTLFVQRHWRGRDMRYMISTVQKYGRQIVLMQKYTRRHLVRIKMRRKRRAGISKVVKFKTCQRVMRGYLGRKKAYLQRQANHTDDELRDFGAGLYRNALVYERDRMIVRTVFSLARDRARVDKRRLRQRESGSYMGVGGGHRSIDEESYRLAGPLIFVFRRFCEMPKASKEMGSMKFAKFCKVGCHNLVLDLGTAREHGFKTEKRALSKAAGGRFGYVRGTDIDLAYSKALADMADLEMELEEQKSSTQRPSSRERKKAAGLSLDGFCRALVYVARSRYLDGHRPESRPGSRGSRPGSRGSRPGSRGNSSRPGTPSNRRGRSLERRNSGQLSRPSSREREARRPTSRGSNRSRSPSRPGTPSQFLSSLSRPGSRQSNRSSIEGDHEHDPSDPTYIRGHTDDEALIIRLCDEHIFGGPLPGDGSDKLKAKKKKKKSHNKSPETEDSKRTSQDENVISLDVDGNSSLSVDHFPLPSNGANKDFGITNSPPIGSHIGTDAMDQEHANDELSNSHVENVGFSASPTSSGQPTSPLGAQTRPGSPSSPNSPETAGRRKSRRHSASKHRKKSQKKELSISSQSRLDLISYCDNRANWAANVVQRAIRGLFGRNLYALALRARANMIRDRERGRQATILQCRWRQRAAKREMIERFRKVVTKYIDPVSKRPYWHNPKMDTTVWTKPKLLIDFGGDKMDVRTTVELPFPDVEYAKACENCNDLVVSRWCLQCDEYYCSKCSEDLHHHGKKKVHDRFPFDVCIECEYQIASRRCNECSDTYCDTCYWRAHSKGNLKLHTWHPLVELCRFCNDPNTALATRVDVSGAMSAGMQQGLFHDAVSPQIAVNEEPNDNSDSQNGVKRYFPENDHMCLQCYNTSWYSQGYASTPLAFRIDAVEAEKARIAAEEQAKLDAEAKKRREERDERRRIIALVTKLQANFRRKKTGKMWLPKLFEHHKELATKARYDKINAQKETWWYKVKDAAESAPVLESDTYEERKRKLVPRKYDEDKLRLDYPWMSDSQSKLFLADSPFSAFVFCPCLMQHGRHSPCIPIYITHLSYSHGVCVHWQEAEGITQNCKQFELPILKEKH